MEISRGTGRSTIHIHRSTKNRYEIFKAPNSNS